MHFDPYGFKMGGIVKPSMATKCISSELPKELLLLLKIEGTVRKSFAIVEKLSELLFTSPQATNTDANFVKTASGNVTLVDCSFCAFFKHFFHEGNPVFLKESELLQGKPVLSKFLEDPSRKSVVLESP